MLRVDSPRIGKRHGSGADDEVTGRDFEASTTRNSTGCGTNSRRIANDNLGEDFPEFLVPLTIEGSGFGTLPVGNLPYATTGWSSAASSYLTITDLNSQGVVNWSSPNANCQMYIQKWTDSSITVVPNVEPDMMNGTQTTISLLTETNPFSLLASPSCPVIAGDNIQVTVINPQLPTLPSASLPRPVTVGTFTGSLN